MWQQISVRGDGAGRGCRVCAHDPSPGLLHLPVCSRHTVHMTARDSRVMGSRVHRSVLTGAFKSFLNLGSASESGLHSIPLLAPRRMGAGHQESQKDLGLTSVPQGAPPCLSRDCRGTASQARFLTSPALAKPESPPHGLRSLPVGPALTPFRSFYPRLRPGR